MALKCRFVLQGARDAAFAWAGDKFWMMLLLGATPLAPFTGCSPFLDFCLAWPETPLTKKSSLRDCFCFLVWGHLCFCTLSLFKLRDHRSFAGLETVTSHDAPEKIATRHLVSVVDGHHIFGWAARDQDDDVGLGGWYTIVNLPHF
jgi:hypothetical protein